MADLTGPVSYLEKLQFAQRAIRGARYRHDQKQAVRELCEGVYEVVLALLMREEGKEGISGGQQDEPKPNT